MPNHPDAVSLLHSLRREHDENAFDPEAPAAQQTLERILATPAAPAPARAPRRGPTPRRVAVVAATGALATTAIVLSPFVHDSPDVIARAAAALDQPDTILHFTAEQRFRDSADELRARTPDARVDNTMEVWQTAGARQQHIIDGPNELTQDWNTKTALGFDAQLDELIRETDPRVFDPADRVRGGLDQPTPLASMRDDLARVLERARNGDGDVRLLGDTTIRGIAVHELRVDYTVGEPIVPSGGVVTDPRGLPTRAVQLARLIYVDSETYLPVRVVELGPGGVENTISDYTATERLPRTPANERLLRMSPHPGAKQVLAGRP